MLRYPFTGFRCKNAGSRSPSSTWSHDKEVRNMATALFQHCGRLFTFIEHPGVEPTNKLRGTSLTHRIAVISRPLPCSLSRSSPLELLLGFMVGWGLLERQSWARPLAISLGVLALFHPLLGTALGIYTLWAMLSANGEEYNRVSRSA